MNDNHDDNDNSHESPRSSSNTAIINPITGFTPPSTKKEHHRKNKPDVILTANVTAVTTSPPSFPMSPHDRQLCGSAMAQSTAGVCNDTQKGLLRKESSPPIASITADLDLAAKEDHISGSNSCDKDSDSLSHEIDAIVSAKDCNHDDDDTDALGFDFDSSPTKHNNNSLLSTNKNSIQEGLAKISSGNGSSPREPPPFHDYMQKQQNSNLESFYRMPPISNVLGSNHGFGFSSPRSTRPSKKVIKQNDKEELKYLSSPAENFMAYHLSLDTKDNTSSSRPNYEEYVNNTANAKAKSLLRSPPPKKRRYIGSLDSKGKSDYDLLASPGIDVFRSPRDNPKASPSLHSAGLGGSFEMMEDTPRQRIEDFSYVFQDHSPGIHGPDQKFMITGTLSDDDDVILNSTHSRRDVQRKVHPPSPHLTFDLSPIQASPLQNAKNLDRIAFAPAPDDFGQFAPLPYVKRSPVKLEAIANSNIRDIQSKIPIKQRQVPANNYQRQTVPGTMPGLASPSCTTYKLSLGPGAMRSKDTRKGLEGINSVVHSQVQQGKNKSVNNYTETPVRTQPLNTSTPSTGMKMNIGYPGSGHRPPMPMSIGHASTFISATPTPKRVNEGKENKSPQTPRNPCNCKKSNCLKLYCVCFQQQLFCSGCNCNECKNTEAYNEIRTKAIQDTIAKNPIAFKPRFSTKTEVGNNLLFHSSPSQSHNMGCKCKKSQCLKKYCECFDASVICSQKCKCVECQNYLGSQQLIDRRRKIKDVEGAVKAMRSSEYAWKNGMSSGMKNGTIGAFHPSPAPHTMGQTPTLMYPMPMISPPPGVMHYPHQYMGGPHMMMAPLGYAPMSMQPITPFSASGAPPRSIGREKMLPPPPPPTSHLQKPRSAQKRKPKGRASRKCFDPHSIKKKGQTETANNYFGSGNAAQTKTTALTIFSFLSNDEIYNASLVCHAWSKLSLDEELWQFDDTQ